jgi:hypothetical protein
MFGPGLKSFIQTMQTHCPYVKKFSPDHYRCVLKANSTAMSPEGPNIFGTWEGTP